MTSRPEPFRSSHGQTESETVWPDARVVAPLSRTWLGALAKGLIFPAYLGLYLIVQCSVEPRFSLQGSLDAAIPFVPEMIVVYFSFFPFVAVCPFLVDQRTFATGLLACSVAAAVAFVAFLLAPTSMVRPDPSQIDGLLLRTAFEWLHWIDGTHNTFPSLHVAITWICALGAHRWLRHGWMALPVAVAISLSTVLVKQHTVADLIGGFAVALLSFRVALRLPSLRSPQGSRPQR